MVKVALVQAPYSDNVFENEESVKELNPPLGLYTLQAFSRDISDIRVFDGEMYRSQNSLIRDIEGYNPEIMGITTVSHSFQRSRELANHFSNKALLIAGGPYATFRDKECLDDFDIVVRGEGVETLREIIEGRPLLEIDGISFKKQGRILRAPKRKQIRDLDSIPDIEWSEGDFNSYSRASIQNNNTRTGYMVTSMGCAFDCGYCCSDVMWGGVRFKGTEKVIGEIEKLNGKHGAEDIVFWDDTFTLRPDSSLMPILTELKKREISFSCNARADSITEKKIGALANSGCREIFFGGESAVPEIRRELGRKMTNEQMKTAFELAKKYKINTVGSFIFGSPSETAEDIEKTTRFAIELNPDKVLFNILAPHPGTPIYNFAVSQEIIEHFRIDNERWTGEPLGIPTVSRDLTREQLQQLKFEAYKRFYGRESYLAEQLKKCDSLDSFLAIQNIAETYL